MRDRIEVIYEGAYASGEIAGPFRNGELCLPPRPGVALVALRLHIGARPGMVFPDPAPSSAAPTEFASGPIAGAEPPSVETGAPAEEAAPSDPAAAALRYEMDLVREHFDPAYYLATLSESPSKSELADIGLLQHFCAFGWKEGRDPCEWFSVERYLGAHPDVAEAGWNPLVHYVSYGKDESRGAFPVTRSWSPDREALAAKAHEVEMVRGELAVARKVSQALFAALRDDFGLSPSVTGRPADIPLELDAVLAPPRVAPDDAASVPH